MYKFMALVALLVSSQAWAGIYLEPYVGYFEGTVKDSGTIVTPLVDAGNFSGSVNAHGPTFGAKAGVSVMTFAFGADYMASSTSGNGSSDTTSNIGAFAQFSVPLVAKFSATYFFSTTDTGSSSGNSLSTKLTGNGFKAGIGLSMFPLISVNVDYISMSYSKLAVTGFTFSGFSATDSGVMVGISIPLDL